MITNVGGARLKPSADTLPRTQANVGIAMIKFLANIFRGFSLVFGVTAPPPGQDERPFVFLWLGIIAVVIAFAVLLFYVLSHLHVG
jgi:hypothetical protein